MAGREQAAPFFHLPPGRRRRTKPFLVRILHTLGNVGMTGVETFLLCLAEAQRLRGDEPHIACAFTGRDELLRTAARVGVDVHPLPVFDDDRAGLLRKLDGTTLLARRVAAMTSLARRGFDVVHPHVVGVGGLESLLAAKAAGVPALVTHHATLEFFAPFRSRQSDLGFALEKRWVRASVTPYAKARDELIAHGVTSGRSHVVPFCVDLRKFERGEAAASAPGELRLLMASRLVPGKGHPELVDAIAALAPQWPKLHLTILGDGPERGAIEARIATHGVQGHVTLVGHVRNEDVPAHMRKAHAVVLPSYMPGETFPICLLEAMALGLPTIGTDWFGIPDIIADGVTGFVVPPRDSASLATAVAKLAGDPELRRRFGEAGRARAEKELSAEAVANRYADLY